MKITSETEQRNKTKSERKKEEREVFFAHSVSKIPPAYAIH
jgi:hypothetical protein